MFRTMINPINIQHAHFTLYETRVSRHSFYHTDWAFFNNEAHFGNLFSPLSQLYVCSFNENRYIKPSSNSDRTLIQIKRTALRRTPQC